MRRTAGCLGRLRLALLVAAAGASAAIAQSYPTKPVRLLVGFPGGGTSDIVARLVGDKLSETLGQQFVIDNRAGAAGNIATELAAKSAPDGYTLFLISGSTTVAPSLYARLGFDVERDFAPITRFADVPFILAVNPALPAKSVQELVALARAKPGQLNFASSGLGTPAHLAGELFKSMAKVDVVHVPYKGTTPAFVDLLSGRVQFYFTSFPTALPQIATGKLRALAVSGTQRSPSLPDVPTVAESGLTGYVAGSWYGLAAPAATPQSLIERLNDSLQRALRTGDMRDKLLAQGVEPVIGVTPAQFRAFIRQDLARWAAVVKSAGARVE